MHPALSLVELPLPAAWVRQLNGRPHLSQRTAAHIRYGAGTVGSRCRKNAAASATLKVHPPVRRFRRARH